MRGWAPGSPLQLLLFFRLDLNIPLSFETTPCSPDSEPLGICVSIPLLCPLIAAEPRLEPVLKWAEQLPAAWTQDTGTGPGTPDMELGTEDGEGAYPRNEDSRGCGAGLHQDGPLPSPLPVLWPPHTSFWAQGAF